MYLRHGLGAVETATILDPSDIPQLTPTIPISSGVEALISKVSMLPGLSQAFQAARNQGYMTTAAPKAPSSSTWLDQNGKFVLAGAGVVLVLALTKGRR